MSGFAERLAAIAKRKEEIAKQYQNLLDNRKKEVMNYFEKFDLLHTSDVLLCGMLAKFRDLLKANDASLKELESLGTKFLKQKSSTRSTKATKSNFHPIGK